jgi:hypothetical protein
MESIYLEPIKRGTSTPLPNFGINPAMRSRTSGVPNLQSHFFEQFRPWHDQYPTLKLSFRA